MKDSEKESEIFGFLILFCYLCNMKYMIGNWVYNTLSKTNERVTNVIGPYCDTTAPGGCTTQIKPVNLSKEILMKNGFVEHLNKYNMTYHWTTGGTEKYCDVDVIVGKDINGLWRWDGASILIKYYRGNYTSHCKKYVHELQQALVVCEQEEFADKFEI